MPFASGYVLLAEGANAEAVAGELASMGFEVYYTDVPGKLVYYVESDDIEGLEALIRSAERVPGVLKAYVVYAFLGDREEAMRLEEALAFPRPHNFE